MRTRPAAAALATAALLAGCTGTAEPPVPVAGDASPQVTGTYVALGDSVAEGVGDRQGGGYVERLVDLLRSPGGCGAATCPRLTLVDTAVAGATTGSVLSTQVPRATQALRAAAPGAPRLVTVTVGGNDVVTPIAEACGSGVTAECTRAVDRSYGVVATNLARALDALREAGGPRTTIAVMTYYNSFRSCRLSELAPLADQVLEGDPALGIASFNDLLASVARERGAVVVGTADVVGADELVGGRDCLHPNPAGHARIAEAFRSAVGPLLARKGDDG